VPRLDSLSREFRHGYLQIFGWKRNNSSSPVAHIVNAAIRWRLSLIGKSFCSRRKTMADLLLLLYPSGRIIIRNQCAKRKGSAIVVLLHNKGHNKRLPVFNTFIHRPAGDKPTKNWKS